MYTTGNPAGQIRSPNNLSFSWDPSDELPFAAGALPKEFFDSRVSLAAVCPETTLMYAVLEDAFLDFQKVVETGKRSIEQAREAEEWFFSDESRWLFSFVSICTVLGLEPEYMRTRLKRLRQSRLD